VWWAKLEPGGFVVPHIDAGHPFHERWHIPVEPAGWFWEDGMYIKAPDTVFEVHHWKPHAVWNPTDKVRIHIIVDRDIVPADAPESSALILTDMIPEVAALM
jgi:hypothetical protein